MLITATMPKQPANERDRRSAQRGRQTENGAIVYAVIGGKAEAVPVKVGVQTDTLAQVISPKIQPGTQVITTRPDALKDGSVVARERRTPGPSPSRRLRGSKRRTDGVRSS